MENKDKMEVEIWSDIMCPWCYIGKRRFEKALEQFDGAAEIQLNWKSFQLNPQMKTMPDKNIIEYLSEIKGWSITQSQEMHQHVTSVAKESGLIYDFEKAVVANSFDAHRLIQLAKTKGLGDQAEEHLFRSYFTEGKNIADHGILVQIGKEIGLDAEETQQMLENNEYAEAVQQNIYEAQQVGVRGVPFFVFNSKYAVSGAQTSEVFLQAIQQSFAEWKESKTSKLTTLTTGESCTTDGECN
jgi:predicted DsbA family dithiol-disulfide isomerase